MLCTIILSVESVVTYTSCCVWVQLVMLSVLDVGCSHLLSTVVPLTGLLNGQGLYIWMNLLNWSPLLPFYTILSSYYLLLYHWLVYSMANVCIFEWVSRIDDSQLLSSYREALLSVSTNFFEEVDLGAEGVKVRKRQTDRRVDRQAPKRWERYPLPLKNPSTPMPAFLSCIMPFTNTLNFFTILWRYTWCFSGSCCRDVCRNPYKCKLDGGPLLCWAA